MGASQQVDALISIEPKFKDESVSTEEYEYNVLGRISLLN